jgi:hypothetical protein
MKTKDAIKHFRTQTDLAKLLGTGQSTIASWGEYPPPLRQLQIESLSGGALKAEKAILPRKVSKLRYASATVNMIVCTACAEVQP